MAVRIPPLHFRNCKHKLPNCIARILNATHNLYNFDEIKCKMMDKYYENNYACFHLSNQIVYIDLKEHVIINLDVAVRIASDRMLFQEYKEYPALLTLNCLFDTDKSGRDYLAKYGWLFTKRLGIIAKSPKAIAIANFYLLRNKPNVATKIFENKIDALHYIVSI